MVLVYVAAASVVLLLATVCLSEPNKDVPLALTVGELTDCPEFSKMPMRPTKNTFLVDYQDGDMYINSTLVLEQPLEDPITLRFEFFKCMTKEEESCSLQGANEQDAICNEIPKKGMVWSPFVEGIEDFPTTCPIPAGKYKLVNGPITKAVRDSGMKFDQGHYRIKTKMIKDNETVACVWGYGEVKPKRRARSKDKKGKE